MILELQSVRPHYEELLALLLRELLIRISRRLADGKKQNVRIQEEMEEATRYFNRSYNQNISIEDYAVSKHMSACWFIRNSNFPY